MSDSTLWWVVTGVLVALELTSGTFYLLMLAIGAGAGAAAAHLGLGAVGQMTAAAVVGGLAVFGCYLVRRRRPGDPSPRADRSVNLDVGEIVQIDQWDTSGAAQIRYRGAAWTAVYRGSGQPVPGRFQVIELQGNRLIVEPA